MGCDNRCNSSLACGLTNTIIRKLIAENCGEEGIEEPGTSDCEATFVTATEFLDHENRYSVTYSFNGGPKESFYDEQFYFLIDSLTLHPFDINKAIFILNPDNLPNGIVEENYSNLAGFTHDGFMAGDLGKRNILNENELFFDANYPGPFSFSPEVNTLEIFPTMDVSGIDLYDYFGGGSLDGAPIVVKSCSKLSLGNKDMPA